ncbi:hypothetical protein [Echinicola vietnamensis]|uniref:Lipoprotein n=1 Tax=Echinicola vietnamensis (strain DSM 17526 / LMG 23754 / KMM 6221) TaxID=926556 RepID=L0FZM9_ECHVK|nr:hypothetical protein [Echinicola vietnamensis]AGA78211.1 hypothetical protein Echvi_1957 [Echinicola vietnamensis DSM 17526]
MEFDKAMRYIILIFVLACAACKDAKQGKSVELIHMDDRDTTFYMNRVLLKNNSNSDWRFTVGLDTILSYERLIFFKNGQEKSPITDFPYKDTISLLPKNEGVFILYTTYDFSKFDSIKIRLTEGGKDYLLAKKSDYLQKSK